MDSKPSIVALIPARAGSKRIPGKNTRLLAGHPLIAYTIAAAQESGIFAAIHVCTDDMDAYDIARSFGLTTVLRQPVSDEQPDIDWVRNALVRVEQQDAFAILRPTSPFRSAATIQNAWSAFQQNQPCDSIRAVEPVRQNPYKMWRWQGYQLLPLLDQGTGPVPLHSRPSQCAPTIYVQNASLEIAWTKTVTEQQSISGDRIAPFFTEGYEGFDLNTERDWREAERLIATGEATLPALPVARVQTAPSQV